MPGAETDEVVSAVGGRSQHDIGRVERCQSAVDRSRIHRGGVRADHDDPVRDLESAVAHVGHPLAEVAVRLGPVVRRAVSQPGAHILPGTGGIVADGYRRVHAGQLVDHGTAHAPIHARRGRIPDTPGQPRLDRSGAWGLGKDEHHRPRPPGTSLLARHLRIAHCSRTVPLRQLRGAPAQEEPRDEGGIADPPPYAAFLFVAARAGDEVGGQRTQPSCPQQPPVEDHVFHDRLVGVGPEREEKVAPDQKPLVAVDEPGASHADALAALDQPVEEVRVADAQPAVGGVAAVCSHMLFDRCEGGTVQPGVGVQHQEPRRAEEDRPGVHLARASEPAPHDPGTSPASGFDGSVT